MKRVFSFMAGALCGALVGGVVTLLLAPVSGEDLRGLAEARWQSARNEAQLAMDERQRELEAEFDLVRRA